MKRIMFLLVVCIIFIPTLIAEAEDLVLELQIEDNVIKYEDGRLIKNIDGFVIDKATGSISNALNGQKVYDKRTGLTAKIDGGHFELSIVTASSGRYQLEMVNSSLIKNIGSTIYLDINSNNVKDSNEFRILMPFYAVIPNFELDNKIEFNCGEKGYVSVSGTIFDSNKQDIGIRYKGERFIDTIQVRNNGSFGFLLNNKIDLDHGGELELVLEMRPDYDPGDDVIERYEVVIATGKVSYLDLDATLSHSNIPEGTLNNNFKIAVNNLPNWYYYKDKLHDDYILEAKLYDHEDNELTKIGKSNILINNGNSELLNFSPFSRSALNKLPIGNYKIIVDLKRIEDSGTKVNEVIYRNSYELKITSSDGDILVGEDLFVDRDCGTLTVDLGGLNFESPYDDIVYYKNGKAVKNEKSQKQVVGGYVLKYFSPGQRPKIVHTLLSDDDKKTIYPSTLPAGLSQSQFLGVNKSVVDIPLLEGGEFRYILDVYEINNGIYQRCYTKNGSFNLKGFQVSIKESEVYPNKKVNQIIGVKDENGVEVNNAIIYVGKNIYGVNQPEKRRSMSYALNKDGKYAGERGYMFIDSASSNIINGLYQIEDWQVEGSGYLNVVVYRHNKDNTTTRMAVVENAILIKGINAWNVSISEDSTRPGQEKTYYLNVKDGDGNKVIPNSIDILEDGVGWRTINSIEINSNSTDNGIKIIHTCRNETVGDIEFKPRNKYGSNTGSAIVEVIRPEIKFKNDELPIITQDFIKKLEFSVIDPKTGNSIYENLYYELVNCGSTAEGGLFSSADALGSKLDKLSGSSLYQVYALVKNLNFEEINYAGVSPFLRLNMVSDDTGGDIKLIDIPIKKAQLFVTPADVNEETKDITVTYVDAMGYPIVDKLIKVNYRKCGNTDKDGKIHYYITTKSDTLSILGDTDVKYRFAERELNIKKDSSETASNSKIVSAPNIVKQPRVTIRLSHSEEMLHVFVNGIDEMIKKPVNFYMAKVYDLQPGNNEIKVDIYDRKHMSYSETIRVFYEKDFEPVVFKIGEKGPYGTPVLINGITMVPVKFAKDLGAEMSWNPKTHTVSYVRGNKDITMTVGSSYALVNEKMKELQMAPYYNDDGRVMVPLSMVADELGFRVKYKGQFEPIEIRK